MDWKLVLKMITDKPQKHWESYQKLCRWHPNEEVGMDSVQIARVAHEVNRAYCEALGDTSQPMWEMAPDWQTKSAINGVEFHRNNPTAGPESSHESWLKEKEADGWKYGPTKQPLIKEHPCCLPFSDLPKEQQAKDFIFRAVVHALIEPIPTAMFGTGETTTSGPSGVEVDADPVDMTNAQEKSDA